ncbi:MAG: response regulator transcription factor [Flavobacteriia bacterium]|nr:response regulator transcription factor [Flavobacteriia bacterium]
MKLVLADSNELIRIGLRTVISNHSSIEIIGEATHSKELCEMLSQFETDMVLIDYTSVGFDLNCIPLILNNNPKLKFIAITDEQSPTIFIDALRSGIKSYIKKDCAITEIIDSVKETAKGNSFYCGQILESIKNANIDLKDINIEDFSCEPVLISERESEIIKLIAEGLTNIEIADFLCLSTHTINTHRKNIMSKLGVKNTAGIVLYAVKMNWISPNKFLFASEVKS